MAQDKHHGARTAPGSATKISARVCCTSVTSSGAADSVQIATGKPLLSATPMIFVPFPRLVFPTPLPFLGRPEASINEGFFKLESATEA
jgi:hypothetical protein